MGVTTIKPPSLLQFITFPVFALTWHASPPGTPHSCSAVAYCGGGGSAKTGVDNSVHVVIRNMRGERTVRVTTGVDIGVGVALFQVKERLLVLVALGDGVRLYSIPVLNEESNDIADDNEEGEEGEEVEEEEEEEEEGEEVESIEEEAKLLVQTECGPKYGSNAVTFNPMGNGFAVGCENGTLCVYSLTYAPPSPETRQESAQVSKYVELEGHVKAICTANFHPRNPYIISTSAKDGTCRIWDLRSKSCFDTLECKIYDPSRPPPENQSIVNPKPGQLLVRGCAFGNLEGDVIYTVQSGRKGGAFLSVWRLVSVPVAEEKKTGGEGKDGGASGGDNNSNGANPAAGPPPNNSRPPPAGSPPPSNAGPPPNTSDPKSSPQKQTPPQQPQPPKTIQKFKEVHRVQIAPYPVSAMALSGDFQTLTYGDTDGTVTLFSIEHMKTIKSWESIHDLPVTCIAARPLPLEFPGDEEVGVMMDAISASADNKLLFLTREKRSRKRVVSDGGGGKGGSWFSIWSLVNLMMILSIVFALKVSFDVCQDEFTDFGHLDPVIECVRDTVFWAAKDRPGVFEVPR